MCFLGVEKAFWVGVATSPSSSGFFPQSEQCFVGGGGQGKELVRRAGAERKAGPFKCKSDSCELFTAALHALGCNLSHLI